MGIRSNWIPILMYYGYYYRGYRKRMAPKPKVKDEKKMKSIQVQKTIQKTMDRIGADIEKKGGFKTAEEIEAYKEDMAQLKNHKYQKTIKESFDEAKSYIKTQSCSSNKKANSYLPIPMTRISPFFPMSRYEMKNRPVEKWAQNTGWGQITFEGRKLSIYDESILLVLLSLAKKYQSEDFETTQYEICKISGVVASPASYNAIWNSIDRLAKTSISIDVKNDSTNVCQLTGTILFFGFRNNETGKLKIILNPYFLKTFGAKLITRINLNFRNSLKGDITKTLYRFFEGQKDNKYRCRVTTLAKAVNLNLDLPLRKLRSRFRNSLRELKNKEYLSKWAISDEDMVIIWKNN